MNQMVETLGGDSQVLELGVQLGQRRAFGMVAGRCSAANAECLRKIREEKTYLRFAPNWDYFCEQFLKMSSRTADRVIALEKELGPLYFEAAEMTGITPAAFRAIRHAFQEDGIHVGGEVIALIPANADRAIEAVARLQAEVKPAESADPPAVARTAALEKRGRRVAADLMEIAEAGPGEKDRQALLGAVETLMGLLARVQIRMQ